MDGDSSRKPSAHDGGSLVCWQRPVQRESHPLSLSYQPGQFDGAIERPDSTARAGLLELTYRQTALDAIPQSPEGEGRGLPPVPDIAPPLDPGASMAYLRPEEGYLIVSYVLDPYRGLDSPLGKGVVCRIQQSRGCTSDFASLEGHKEQDSMAFRLYLLSMPEDLVALVVCSLAQDHGVSPETVWGLGDWCSAASCR